MKKLILAVAMLFLSATAYADTTITMAWDASPGINVAGYRLYQKTGTAYDFTSPVWDGSELTCTVTVPNTAVYSWVVTAYNTAGVESGPSNELTIDLTPPASPANLDATVIVVVNP